MKLIEAIQTLRDDLKEWSTNNFIHLNTKINELSMSGGGSCSGKIITTNGTELSVFVGTQEEYAALDDTENVFAIFTDDPSVERLETIETTLADLLDKNSTTKVGKAVSADTATKATKDGDGNVITDTYASINMTGLGNDEILYDTGDGLTGDQSTCWVVYGLSATANLAHLNIPHTYRGKPVVGVGSIGGGISGNSKLKTVSIASGVRSISSDAFKACTNLTSVYLPDSIENILSSAFEGCTKLTDVRMSNGITSIGANAFKGCTSLKYIFIPKSVTMINANAFSGCTNLTIFLESDAYEYAFDSTWAGSCKVITGGRPQSSEAAAVTGEWGSLTLSGSTCTLNIPLKKMAMLNITTAAGSYETISIFRGFTGNATITSTKSGSGYYAKYLNSTITLYDPSGNAYTSSQYINYRII